MDTKSVDSSLKAGGLPSMSGTNPNGLTPDPSTTTPPPRRTPWLEIAVVASILGILGLTVLVLSVLFFAT